MNSITVLFMFDVCFELKNYLRSHLQFDEIQLIFPDLANEDEFLKLAPNADIIVGWKPDKDLLEMAANLKLFINPGAGIQRTLSLFKEINKRRNVTLVNGHGNAYFTAQHAVGLLLAVLNKIVLHNKWMEMGCWKRGDSFAKSIPLRNKVVGLLGYGAINQHVRKFLAGFDIEFCILKRTAGDVGTNDAFYTIDQLHDFLERTDILIAALPQTAQTIDLIKKEELKLLGPQGIIINVARGLIFNQNDLFEALKNKSIQGAGIDAWYNYGHMENIEGEKPPFDKNKPFHELDNVVSSPHRAASPFDDLQRWDEQIHNIIAFAKGEELRNVVDLENEY